MELQFLTKDAVKFGTQKAFAGIYNFYVSAISGILVGLAYLYYKGQPLVPVEVILFIWSIVASVVFTGLLFGIPIEIAIAHSKKRQYQYLEKLSTYNEGRKKALLFLVTGGWATLIEKNIENYMEHFQQTLLNYKEATNQKFAWFCWLADPIKKQTITTISDFFEKLREYDVALKAIDCSEPHLELYMQNLTGQSVSKEKWNLIWKAAGIRNELAIMLKDLEEELSQRETLSAEISGWGQAIEFSMMRV